MLEKIVISVGVAWQNIRANPLHTALSTLGIVIGVGALVSILSLADGLEQHAREQIESTTSLQTLIVQSRTSRQVDGIRVEREDVPVLGPEEAAALHGALEGVVSVSPRVEGSALVRRPDGGGELGVTYAVLTAGDPLLEQAEGVAGASLAELVKNGEDSSLVVNHALARRLSGDGEVSGALGTQAVLNGRSWRVAGVVEDDPTGLLRAVMPMEALSREELRAAPPRLVLQAERVEEVPRIEEDIRVWLDGRFAEGEEAFAIATNRMRVEQASRAMLIFKVIMGLITGISVVVGGIGVMNVLLVSITERTSEIGIRKATGAKRRDILLQFLSESVTISSLGSALGLLLGMGVSLASVPLVTWLTDAPFRVVFTAETFLIIGLIALIIGIVFGTYPALRAARLTPIDAIRRE
ncbi:MAG: ABC transporter permease [Balneolaceae bacterium]|nr:ABC transporter permease [Balneolaceae bacterium]